MSKKDSKQNYSNQSILYIALMRHKKGLLLVILIAMISSSLAWFYNSLSTAAKIDGEVNPWNVSTGDSQIYSFGFDVLKPGVEYLPQKESAGESQNIIPINNDGSSDAYLSLEVRNIYLFGEKLVKEGTTNEDGNPNPNIQYRVTREKITQDSSEGEPGKKIVRYEIIGFPWDIIIDFPDTILKSGTSEDIEFTLIWNFDGDTTPVDIAGDTTGKTQPTCLSHILDPNILNYVETQKDLYEKMDINIDNNDLLPPPTGSESDIDSQYRITTCDIIDTYYGEQSVKFKKEKSSKDIISIDDLYYRRKTDAEDVKRPKKDLFIEMSLTATQAGGHSSNTEEGTPSTSEPVTNP